MPTNRPRKKAAKRTSIRMHRRPVKPAPKLARGRNRQSPLEIGEMVRKRAEAEAAIADARKSHERLREAIDILPQGIVFLDAEGRYILWNKKYAEIYNRSADLFKPGARLADTIRVGVARGDYPEAKGREQEWIAERLKKLHQPGARHEQTLADGRVVLIEERLTSDGGVIGLRVDITELKQREASFRLLFDSNPVPMIVCALDGERILGVNDAAAEHYGHSRAEFEKLTIRSLQAFDSKLPWMGDASSDEQAARTWKHVRADGALIDLAIYSRQLVYGDQPAVLLALMASRACRIAPCCASRWTTCCCIPAAAPKNSRCWCSGSTISRRSTIRSATASATSCCARWPSGCARPCATKTPSPASTPTNSRFCRAASPGPRTSCSWRGGCWRRLPIPSCSKIIRS
jgi:PAS domain S-box-containing protein